MSDLFERLQTMSDRIQDLMKGENERAEKLEREVNAMEVELLLAMAAGALKAAAADCRHERVRVQAKGALDQITKLLRAA